MLSNGSPSPSPVDGYVPNPSLAHTHDVWRKWMQRDGCPVKPAGAAPPPLEDGAATTDTPTLPPARAPSPGDAHPYLASPTSTVPAASVQRPAAAPARDPLPPPGVPPGSWHRDANGGHPGFEWADHAANRQAGTAQFPGPGEAGKRDVSGLNTTPRHTPAPFGPMGGGSELPSRVASLSPTRTNVQVSYLQKTLDDLRYELNEVNVEKERLKGTVSIMELDAQEAARGDVEELDVYGSLAGYDEGSDAQLDMAALVEENAMLRDTLERERTSRKETDARAAELSRELGYVKDQHSNNDDPAADDGTPGPVLLLQYKTLEQQLHAADVAHIDAESRLAVQHKGIADFEATLRQILSESSNASVTSANASLLVVGPAAEPRNAFGSGGAAGLARYLPVVSEAVAKQGAARELLKAAGVAVARVRAANRAVFANLEVDAGAIDVDCLIDNSDPPSGTVSHAAAAVTCLAKYCAKEANRVEGVDREQFLALRRYTAAAVPELPAEGAADNEAFCAALQQHVAETQAELETLRRFEAELRAAAPPLSVPPGSSWHAAFAHHVREATSPAPTSGARVDRGEELHEIVNTALREAGLSLDGSDFASSVKGCLRELRDTRAQLAGSEENVAELLEKEARLSEQLDEHQAQAMRQASACDRQRARNDALATDLNKQLKALDAARQELQGERHKVASLEAMLAAANVEVETLNSTVQDFDEKENLTATLKESDEIRSLRADVKALGEDQARWKARASDAEAALADLQRTSSDEVGRLETSLRDATDRLEAFRAEKQALQDQLDQPMESALSLSLSCPSDDPPEPSSKRAKHPRDHEAWSAEVASLREKLKESDTRTQSLEAALRAKETASNAVHRAAGADSELDALRGDITDLESRLQSKDAEVKRLRDEAKLLEAHGRLPQQQQPPPVQRAASRLQTAAEAAGWARPAAGSLSFADVLSEIADHFDETLPPLRADLAAVCGAVAAPGCGPRPEASVREKMQFLRGWAEEHSAGEGSMAAKLAEKGAYAERLLRVGHDKDAHINKLAGELTAALYAKSSMEEHLRARDLQVRALKERVGVDDWGSDAGEEPGRPTFTRDATARADERETLVEELEELELHAGGELDAGATAELSSLKAALREAGSSPLALAELSIRLDRLKQSGKIPTMDPAARQSELNEKCVSLASALLEVTRSVPAAHEVLEAKGWTAARLEAIEGLQTAPRPLAEQRHKTSFSSSKSPRGTTTSSQVHWSGASQSIQLRARLEALTAALIVVETEKGNSSTIRAKIRAVEEELRASESEDALTTQQLAAFPDPTSPSSERPPLSERERTVLLEEVAALKLALQEKELTRHDSRRVRMREFAKLEESIVALKDELHEKDEALDESQLRSTAEKAELQEDIVFLRQDLLAREKELEGLHEQAESERIRLELDIAGLQKELRKRLLALERAEAKGRIAFLERELERKTEADGVELAALRGELDEKRGLLDDSQKQLLNETTRLRGQVAALETDLRGKCDSLEHTQIGALTAETDHQTEIDSLRRQLTEKQDALHGVQIRLQESQSEYHEHLTSLRRASEYDLEQSLVSHSAARDALQSEAAALRRQLAENADLLSAARAERAAAADEAAAAKRRLREKTEEVDQALAAAARAKGELQDGQAGFRRDLQDRDEAVAHAQRQLRTERASMRDEVAVLQALLAEKEDAVDRAAAAHAVAEAERLGDATAFKRRLQEADSALDAARIRETSLQQQLRDAQDELGFERARAKGEIDALQQVIQEKEDALDGSYLSTASARNDMLRDVSALKAQLREKQDAFSAVQAELRTERTTLEAQAQSLKQQLAEKEDALEQSFLSSTTAKGELQEEAASLRRQLKDKELAIERSKRELRAEVESLQRLLHDREDALEQSLLSNTTAKAEMREEIAALKRQAGEKQDDLDRAHRELARERADGKAEIQLLRRDVAQREEALERALAAGGAAEDELRGELASLKRQLRERDEAVERARGEVGRFEKLLHEKEIDLEQSHLSSSTARGALKDEVTSLNRQLQDRQDEIQRTQRQSTTERTELREEVERLRQLVSEKEDALEQSFISNTTIRDEVRTEVAHLKRELQQKQDELDSSLRELGGDKAALKGEVETLKQQLLEKEDALEQSFLSSTTAKNEMREEVASLRRQLQGKQDELEGEKAGLKEEVEALKQQLRQKEDDLEQSFLSSTTTKNEAREEVASLRRQLQGKQDELDAEKAGLKEEVEALKQQLRQKEDDLEQSFLASTTTKNEAREEVASLRRQLQEKQDDLQHSQKQLANERAALRGELSSLQRLLHEKEDALEQSFLSSTTAKNEMREEVAALREQLRDNQDELELQRDHLKEEASSLQRLLQEKEDALEQSLLSSTTAKNDLREEVATLRRHLQERQDELESSQRERTSERAALKDEVSALRQLLDDKEDAFERSQLLSAAEREELVGKVAALRAEIDDKLKDRDETTAERDGYKMQLRAKESLFEQTQRQIKEEREALKGEILALKQDIEAKEDLDAAGSVTRTDERPSPARDSAAQWTHVLTSGTRGLGEHVGALEAVVKTILSSLHGAAPFAPSPTLPQLVADGAGHSPLRHRSGLPHPSPRSSPASTPRRKPEGSCPSSPSQASGGKRYPSVPEDSTPSASDGSPSSSSSLAAAELQPTAARAAPRADDVGAEIAGLASRLAAAVAQLESAAGLVAGEWRQPPPAGAFRQPLLEQQPSAPALPGRHAHYSRVRLLSAQAALRRHLELPPAPLAPVTPWFFARVPHSGQEAEVAFLRAKVKAVALLLREYPAAGSVAPVLVDEERRLRSTLARLLAECTRADSSPARLAGEHTALPTRPADGGPAGLLSPFPSQASEALSGDPGLSDAQLPTDTARLRGIIEDVLAVVLDRDDYVGGCVLPGDEPPGASFPAADGELSDLAEALAAEYPGLCGGRPVDAVRAGVALARKERDEAAAGLARYEAGVSARIRPLERAAADSANLLRELEKSAEALQHAENERDDARRELAAATNEMKRTMVQVEQQHRETERLTVLLQESVGSTATSANLEARVQQLQEELKELDHTTDELRRKCDQQEATIAELRTAVAILEEEKACLQATRQEEQQSMREALASKSAGQSDAGALKLQNEGLREEVARVTAGWDRAKQAKSELEQAHAMADMQLRQTAQEAEALRQALRHRQRAHEEEVASLRAAKAAAAPAAGPSPAAAQRPAPSLSPGIAPPPRKRSVAGRRADSSAPPARVRRSTPSSSYEEDVGAVRSLATQTVDLPRVETSPRYARLRNDLESKLRSIAFLANSRHLLVRDTCELLRDFTVVRTKISQALAQVKNLKVERRSIREWKESIEHHRRVIEEMCGLETAGRLIMDKYFTEWEKLHLGVGNKELPEPERSDVLHIIAKLHATHEERDVIEQIAGLLVQFERSSHSNRPSVSPRRSYSYGPLTNRPRTTSVGASRSSSHVGTPQLNFAPAPKPRADSKA